MVQLTITALELTNYGPLRGTHRFELAGGGLSVCVRPNESGKTTLLGAVAAVLWGDPRAERNWQSAEEEPYRAMVEFIRSDAGQEERYAVERDFATNEVAAWQVAAEGGRRELFRGPHNPAGRTPDNRRWPDRLTKLWGAITAETFRHMAMLTQPLPDALDGGLVQQLVAGGSSGTVQDAQAALVGRFRTISKLSRDAGLSKSNARNDGRLDELRAERQSLEAARVKAAADLEQLNALRGLLADNEKQIAATERARENAEGALRVIGQFRELKRDLDAAVEEARRWEGASLQIRQSREEIAAADGALQALPAGLDQAAPPQLAQFREVLQQRRLKEAALVDPQRFLQQREQLRQEYGQVWDWPSDAASQIDALGERAAQCETARRHAEEARRRLEEARPQPDAPRRALAAAAAGVAAAVLAGAVVAAVAGGTWATAVGLLSGVAAAAIAWAVYQPVRPHPERLRLAEESAGASSAAEQGQAALRGAQAALAWAGTTDPAVLARLSERRAAMARELAAVEEQERQQQAMRREIDPAGLPEPVRQLLEHCGGSVAQAMGQIAQAEQACRSRAAAEERIASVCRTMTCDNPAQLADRLRQAGDRRVGIQLGLDRMAKEHALAEELARMQGAGVDARRAEFQQAIDRVGKDLQELQAQRQTLQNDVNRAELGMSVNVAEAETELARLDAEIARLAGQCDAIGEAHRLVQAAHQRYASHHREAIERRLNELMAAWTGVEGRRFTVSSEFSLGLVISLPDGTEHKEELTVLSQGAADQLAMAVRTAVLERIGGEVVLPMLVDDALLTWDHARRERIAASLREAAAERQIILASHDPAFLDWGRPVVASCGDPA